MFDVALLSDLLQVVGGFLLLLTIGALRNLSHLNIFLLWLRSLAQTFCSLAFGASVQALETKIRSV